MRSWPYRPRRPCGGTGCRRTQSSGWCDSRSLITVNYKHLFRILGYCSGLQVNQHVSLSNLASVPHCQYVITVPKLLRSAFGRQRAWLGELCRIAARLLTKAYALAAPGARAVSG